MSEVALTGGISYPLGKAPSDVELSSIPLNGSKSPDGSLVLFYGFRDTIEGLSALRRQTEKNGLDFSDVTVTVDVGSENGRLNLETLPKANMLHFRRIAKDVESLVISKWRNYVIEEGIKVDNDYYRNFNYATKNPEFIGKLRMEPEFSHIDVFIYPVKGEDNIVKYNAMLFSSDHVLNVKATGNVRDKINVSLPNFKHRNKPQM